MPTCSSCLPTASCASSEKDLRAIDASHADCGGRKRCFFELFTAGLLTDVFEDAEAVQKGNWGALGDLAAKLVGASPSNLRLGLADDEGERKAIETEAYPVLAMNSTCRARTTASAAEAIKKLGSARMSGRFPSFSHATTTRLLLQRELANKAMIVSNNTRAAIRLPEPLSRAAVVDLALALGATSI